MKTEGPDFSKRWCYTIIEGQRDKNGYIPSAVFEGDPQHYSMRGNGVGAQPWYWGATLDEAWTTCSKVNAERGITPDVHDEILQSSVEASIRARV